MTGTPKNKPPKNNAEWARNTEKRLGAAENPTSVRVGQWVLSTQAETGNLLGSHVEGGSVILAVKPAPSADAADTVSSTDFPYIKLERQTNQTNPGATTTDVQWDTVIDQTSGWGFSPTGSSFTVPTDGTYLCLFHLAFVSSNADTTRAVFMVNGSVIMAQEFNPNTSDPWIPSFYLADTFPLVAGSIITCGAFSSGVGTFDTGPYGALPTVFTSVSVIRLPVG